MDDNLSTEIKETMNLVEKHFAIVNKDLKYLKNVPIFEYDIRDAGFTIIKNKKLLDSKMIEYLETLDKNERNIKIGKLQKDKQYPTLAEDMNNEYIHIRQEFVKLNELYVEDLLCIKKDAIFVIRKQPKITTIDNVYEFREKNQFTSYFYVRNKEIYLKNDELVLKGFKEEIKEEYKCTLLEHIEKFMKMAERLSKKNLYRHLSRFRNDYLTRNLDIEMYRNLDSGMYVFDGYSLDEATNEMKDDVDINYNYVSYVIPLISELL